MLNLFDLGGIERGLITPDDRIIGPRTLPELIYHFHVFVGNEVSLIVGDRLIAAHSSGSTDCVACDNVPTHAAFSKMIQSRELPRENIRVHIRRADSCSKGHCFCRSCHCG